MNRNWEQAQVVLTFLEIQTYFSSNIPAGFFIKVSIDIFVQVEEKSENLF